MELILASMPPLPPQALMPPTPDSGAGEDEFQPPDPFPSAKEPSPSPPAFGAEQASEWSQSADEVPSSDEDPPGLVDLPELEPVPSSDDEPPRVEPVPMTIDTDEMVSPPVNGMRLPQIEMLLRSTGLLSFSMDHMHAALDLCPQMFASSIEDNEKKEEKTEDVEHVDQDVALDGQGEDAAEGESKD
ncbi:MAG: hypothetical protein GY835_22430, partial [bacterium]|nr:hypothetical protein [bacterium]